MRRERTNQAVVAKVQADHSLVTSTASDFPVAEMEKVVPFLHDTKMAVKYLIFDSKQGKPIPIRIVSIESLGFKSGQW